MSLCNPQWWIFAWNGHSECWQGCMQLPWPSEHTHPSGRDQSTTLDTFGDSGWAWIGWFGTCRFWNPQVLNPCISQASYILCTVFHTRGSLKAVSLCQSPILFCSRWELPFSLPFRSLRNWGNSETVRSWCGEGLAPALWCSALLRRCCGWSIATLPLLDCALSNHQQNTLL